MNAKIKKKLNRLMDLCVDAKDFGHDCFLSYLGHVSKVSVNCHINGWVEGKEEDYKSNIYLDFDNVESELDKAIAEIEKLIDDSLIYRDFSEHKVSYEENAPAEVFNE